MLGVQQRYRGEPREKSKTKTSDGNCQTAFDAGWIAP
jgi:hypothetical protein